MKRAGRVVATKTVQVTADEFEQQVTLLRLNKKGKYREVRAKKGELHSAIVPGFWIRVGIIRQREALLPEQLEDNIPFGLPVRGFVQPG